ncbi:MAG: nucleotidyltransferase domain-containing protein [Firmicutes bacterium]|jgi:predicted nucleotidyltransferase|nr:nucleotidyltransferase domain-containing protein [Bacillota bacterium]HOB21310.1 nucleotidyltransferase domain-containing protein [Bacillota bacterium]HQD40191.1 nucleotidyltransferase domain-containing protein [Bacillota bacterium]
MKELVHQMAKRIADKFHPQKIILFGSLARGEAKTESDVDLLIVLECSNQQKRELQVAIRRELRDFKIPKDIIVTNQEELHKYKDAWWTIYQPALKEGVVLYER